ncbi:MAG: response regulator [Rhodospirillaceae bacterium]|nr:MAG: response regulator [Rhodospirillaceae bacterium]
MEVYRRLVRMLEEEFAIKDYSLYEVGAANNQITPLFADGEQNAPCRWCDPQILVHSQDCRARRTEHKADGVLNPGICYTFQLPPEVSARRHICLPIIQSGAVGNILQLIVAPDKENEVAARIPYITVYLQETAPVLEARKLMDTLRESSLRDPMTTVFSKNMWKP